MSTAMTEEVTAPEQKAPADEKKPVDQKPAEKKADDKKPEAKADEGAGKKPGDEGSTKEDGTAKKGEGDGVPEKYEFTIPADSVLGQEHVDELIEEAKAAGLTQKQATSLFDRRQSQVREIREGMLAEAKADKEIGGKHFTRAVEDARRGLEWAYPNAEDRSAIKAILNETGIGNHRLMIGLFARLGRSRREDSPDFKAADGSANKPRTFTEIAERIYAGTPKKE